MITLILIYVFAMVAANLLVWAFGPWFSPINSFLLIGLDLTLRDLLHHKLSKWEIAAVIATGGILTVALNPSASNIALASSVAFVVSATLDWGAYHVMRHRPWLVRSNASNTIGALADSLIFPTLAFGSFMPQIVVMQFLAKFSGGAVWAYVLRNRVPA